MAKWSRRCATFSVVIIVLATGAYLLWQFAGPFAWVERDRRYLVASVTVGMTKSEVVARLGPPRHVAHAPDELLLGTGHYPVPEFPLEKEVLEYYKSVWKLYVYIDRRDRVSRVAIART